MRTFGFVVCVVFILWWMKNTILIRKNPQFMAICLLFFYSHVLFRFWRVNEGESFIKRWYSFLSTDSMIFDWMIFYSVIFTFILLIRGSSIHGFDGWASTNKPFLQFFLFLLPIAHGIWYIGYWIEEALLCHVSLHYSTCWDASTRVRLCILCNESALTSAAIYEMMMICLFQYCAFVSHRVGTRHMMLKYA